MKIPSAECAIAEEGVFVFLGEVREVDEGAWEGYSELIDSIQLSSGRLDTTWWSYRIRLARSETGTWSATEVTLAGES